MDNQEEELLKHLPKDFFKKFKDDKEFQGFMDALFKRGVQQILEGELDSHKTDVTHGKLHQQ